MSGILISLEGIDGSGKSMLAQSIASSLEQCDKNILLTKEPGATPLGLKLRSLLQEQAVPLSSCAEFLLFAADRAEHMQTIIMPALAKGDIIISDRMADSSIAYQGYGNCLDIPLLSAVNAWAMNSIQPHITLYLRLDYATAYERCVIRNQTMTAFEKRGKEYMQRVIEGYDILAQTFPHRIHAIDASQEPQQVLKECLAIITTALCL